MNDIRSDLGYLLRQLQTASDSPSSQTRSDLPVMSASTDSFLDAITSISRQRAESQALLHRAKADLKAINDDLPRWWSMIESEPSDGAIRAAE